MSGWSFALLGALLGWPLMIGLVLGVLPDGISPASLVEAQAVPDDDPAAAYGQGERDSGPSGFWAQPVPAKVTIKVVIPADELAEEGQTPPAAPQAGVEEPPAPN